MKAGALLCGGDFDVRAANREILYESFPPRLPKVQFVCKALFAHDALVQYSKYVGWRQKGRAIFASPPRTEP